ncbi:hypothetical protein OK024_02155 [Acinetobacter sp. UGAL515B_02]|nr:hypothetical protein [Acinetobacter sp. UGAL515B_02]WON80651.1 hypothetical protein OK024_02155 [Acinetobacter sp. UGAL515B_02]
MGSLVGVLLLFLARGIYLKLDAAWYGALILLALAILSSVLTASGWVKVVALLIIFVCILISHRYFYRKSSLFELSPEPFWLISIVLVVAGSTWLGFFAYHHVIYSDDLWWQFSYKNDVSRFLRSSIVIAVLLVAIFIWQLFGISRPEHIEQLDESELNDIENILHQTHDTQGFLALLGDKKSSGQRIDPHLLPTLRPKILDCNGRSGRHFVGIWRTPLEIQRTGRSVWCQNCFLSN